MGSNHPPNDPKRNGQLNGASGRHDELDENSEGGDDALAEERSEDDADRVEELAPPPAIIRELVAACVRFVATRYGVALDGTPDTLSLLDQYVRDAREGVGARPESLQLVEEAVGAYLGEVMRHAFGGSWFVEGERSGWRLDMTCVYLTFNPIGMAREAVLLESADGWGAHLVMDEEDRDEVNRRLEVLGPVEEEEYYAPTTRFDVIALAVDAISAQMVKRGLGDVRFTSEDYRK